MGHSNKISEVFDIEVTMDPNGNGIHLAQSGYEKELLDRWGTETGSEFPMFKLCETDLEGVENIDAGVVRDAQALVAVHKNAA